MGKLYLFRAEIATAHIAALELFYPKMDIEKSLH